MKKSFLILLSSILAVFLITGCADDTTSNNTNNGGNGGSVPSTNTPVDPAKPETLNGTYEVTFFGSQVTNVRDIQNQLMAEMADKLYISNDCAKATELYPDVIGANSKNNCDPTSGQSTLLDGTVLITVSATDMNISSRMQMEGGAVEMSATDKYQYTVYNKTSDLTTFTGKGVKGWNYDDVNNKPSATSTDFPESPYTVTINADGAIRIDMTLVGKVVTGIATVDAKNTIILKKISDDTTPLQNAIMKPFTPAN